MYRYKLTIQYNGYNFEAGWQKQPGKISVQATLEDAVYKVTQEHTQVYGAGRTDQGVHALGQVAHFDLIHFRSISRIHNGLSFYLKKYSIVILDVKQVSEDFHARFSAHQKTYVYCVNTSKILGIFDRHRVHHMPHMLSMEALQQSVDTLIGHHDFTSFRGKNCQANIVVRTLDNAYIKTLGNKLYIYFVAKSFLQYQVRIMVGTVLDLARIYAVGSGGYIGAGKKHWVDICQKPSDVMIKILQHANRDYAGHTAPGHGLYLFNISYDTNNENIQSDQCENFFDSFVNICHIP